MQRRIFIDEDDCFWQCDIETMTVIDKDSEIKGQPIPDTWKEDKPSPPGNLLNSTKKDLWADYKHGSFH